MPPVFIPRDLWQKFQGDAIDQQGQLAKENIAAAEPLSPPESPRPPWTPPAGTPSSTVESPLAPPPLADVMAAAGLTPPANSAAAAPSQATPSPDESGPPPLQDLLQRAGLGGAGAAVGQGASSIGTTAQNAAQNVASGAPPPLQDLMRTAGLLSTPTAATPGDNGATTPAGVPTGDTHQSQFGMGLSDADAYAACGPAAAIGFARANGRNPTSQEAMQLAASVGWDNAKGMAGVGSEQELLQKMGVATKLEQGANLDWGHITKDALNSNPVILDTPGHYLMVDGAKPGQDGVMLYHIGTSGTDLTGGQEWETKAQIEGHKVTGQVRAALYSDNPNSPHPSVANTTSSATATTAGLSGGGNLASKIGEAGQKILSDGAQVASWLGDQGQKALQSVLVTEGGLAGARGDNQASAGPLQFFGEEGGRSGQLNNFARDMGMSLAQARDWLVQNPVAAIQWAIGTPDKPGYLGAAIQAGIQKGLSGPDLATYAQQHGQVSVSPDRAGANFSAMFGAGGGPVSTGTSTPASTDWGAMTQKGIALGLQGQQLTDWINQQQSTTSPTAGPEAAAAAGLARNRAASDATVQAGRAEQEAFAAAPIYHSGMIPGAAPSPLDAGAGSATAASGGSPLDAVKSKFNDALDALGGLFGQGPGSQPAATSATAPAAASTPATPTQPQPGIGDQIGGALAGAAGAGLSAVGAGLGAIGQATEPARTAIAQSPPGQAAGEFFARTSGPSAEYPSGGPWTGPLTGALREQTGIEQQTREFEQQTGVSYADFQAMYSKVDQDPSLLPEVQRLEGIWNSLVGPDAMMQNAKAYEAYGRAPAGEQAATEALGGIGQGVASTLLVPGAIGGGAGGIARAVAAGAVDPGSLPFLGVQGATQLAEPAARAFGAATRGGPPVAGLVAREGGVEGPVINGMTGAIAQRVLEAHNAPIPPEALQDAQRTIETVAGGGGRVTGAPPQAQTAEGLARLRAELTAMAQAGASQKDWYADSSKAILETTQGNPQDAERLAQLVAIYSPNTPVSANMNNALTAWYQWKAGQPISVAMKAQDERASKLLYDGVQWDGRKTNNFYRNLMQYIDPQVYAQMGQEAGQSGVTADIWMMRGFGYPATEEAKTSAGGAREFLKAPTARQYDFIQDEVSRVAQQLGWTPEQAQAAIWTAAKSGSEGSTVEGAGYHYGHAIAERSGQVSWEASPGATAIQDIPGYASGSFAQKQAFHDATAKAFLDEQGHDIIAQKYGLLGGNTFGAAGVYRGEISPGAQTKFALPQARQSVGGVPIPGAVGRIQEDSRDAINAYAATRGLLLKQDAVPWTRIFKTPTIKTSNAAVVDIGRALTPEEAAALDGSLTRALGPDGHAIVSTERGAWLLNLGDTPNASFQTHARNAAEALQSVDEARVAPARYDSEYIANDWTAHPNGEGYRELIGRSGRAEQFGQLEDTLTQRIRSAQAEAARQNGWGPAATGSAPSAPGLLERAAQAIAPRGVAADLLARSPAGSVDRYYHGTGSAFAHPDAAKFDQNGLFGPGYYLTSDPRVAGGVVGPRGDEFGLGVGDLANETIVHEPGYAQNARGTASSIQDEIDAYRAQLAGGQLSDRRRGMIEDRIASLQQELGKAGPTAGPNVRAVDVPKGLNLLNADSPPPPDVKQVLQDAFDRWYPNHQPGIGPATIANDSTLADLYQYSERSGYGSREMFNKALADAGYDGIQYAGGARVPMRDEVGNAIQHDVKVIFPGSLDKVTNASAGTPGGLLPGSGGENVARVVGTRTAVGATGAAASAGQEPGATPESVATAAIQGGALGATRALVGRSIPGIRIPAEVGRIAQAIGGPPGNPRSFDLQKLAQMRQQYQASQPPLVQAATKASKLDRFIGYTATNMLSGVGTAIQNTLGNLGQMLARPVITTAAGYPSDAMRDVAAMSASLSDAFAAYGRTFASGQRAAAHYQAPVGSLKNPLTYPLRNLGATDEFFRTLNSAGAAAAEASRRLRENPTLTFDQVLQRHTNDIVNAAADGAARGVYERGGGLAGWFGEWVASNRAQMLRSNDPREQATGLVLQWLMPMTRVPGVILGEGFRSLPIVNEVRGIQRTVQLARAGDTYAARQEAARTYLTTFANMAILSEVAQGNITGDGPTNPSDKQRLMEAVDKDGNAMWRPNSVRVGGKWIDYAGLGPLALPMSSIANGVDEALDRAQKPEAERGGAPEFLANLANRQARTIGNAWYLKGLADVLSGIKEGTLGGTGSSLTQLADRLVPGEALANEFRKVEDMYAREPSNVLQREANRLPFASRTVPPKLSATTGQALEQPEDWFSTLVRGTPSGMMTPNPVAAEVARLDEAGHRVSVPYDVKSYAGAKQTSDQQRTIHEQVGQAVNMYVLDTLGKANYAGLSDAQKADAVSQAVGQAQSAANISLGGQVARDPHESALLQWAQMPHYYGVKGTPEEIARKNWEVDQARAKLADYRKRYGEAGEARMAKEDKAAFNLTLKYEPLASEEVKSKKAKIDKATGGQLSQQADRAATGGLVGVGSTTLPPQR